MSPFRGLRQGTGRPELHGTADQTNGGGEEGEPEAVRVPDEAGGRRAVKRRSQSSERPGSCAPSREQQTGFADRPARPNHEELTAGHEESRTKPEGRPVEAQQELDSRLAEETDRFSSHDADAEFPAQ